jgi:hypothetical protein
MHPALYGVVLDDLVCPSTKLHSTLIIDLEANGNNHLEAVVLYLPADPTITLCLNYPEIPDSCHFDKFGIREYILDVLVYSTYVNAIQLCYHFLSEPDVFVLIAHLDAGFAITSRSDKRQILSG